MEIQQTNLHELLRMESATAVTDECHVIRIPTTLRMRGPELKLIIDSDTITLNARPDRAMIKAVARAHDWFERLLNGEAKSIAELAASQDVGNRYISRILPLAFLAPDIAQAILDGHQPAELNAVKLTQPGRFPADWLDQRAWLGFTST